MDDIIKECKKKKELHIGLKNLHRIGLSLCPFADDLVTYADSKKNLQKSLEVWDECLTKFGIAINKSKTKVMIITKQEKEIDLEKKL